MFLCLLILRRPLAHKKPSLIYIYRLISICEMQNMHEDTGNEDLLS